MTGIYGHPHERALSLSVFFGTVGTVSPAFIPRPKTKPRTVVGPGRNLSSYRFNYQHTKIGSQCYLRSLCLPQTPRQLPYQSQGSLWTRRDSNPYLQLDRLICSRYPTGPSVAYEGSADLNKVARHIRRAASSN